MTRLALATALALSPALAAAQESDGFVEANILGIFYHELGHALIDVQGIPIFGQEEDAADVFSIFLIDALFEEDAAQDLAYAAAFGFLGEAEMRDESGEEIAWWGVHGPDEQRFYNTICIFYGADPDARTGFAEDLGLPEDRADYCPDEYDQAAASWGAVLDEIATGPAETLVFLGDSGSGASLTEQILAEEIALLNEEFRLDAEVSVAVDRCGEPSAFYDPEAREIVFCIEFEDYLFELAERF